MSEDVLILQGARTAMAELVGAFKDTSALELGGVAARAAMERAGIEPGSVDHVVMATRSRRRATRSTGPATSR